MKKSVFILFLLAAGSLFAQETRLLRQPTLSDSKVAFTYGADVWVTNLENSITTRLTSTGAVESNPVFSPDGKTIAFTSNRSGTSAVYTVPAEGGTPTRLTWYPSGAIVCGWTPDGESVLFASPRETAPAGYDRLWTVSKNGGPEKLLSKQWGNSGSFSPDGKKIAIDRVSRWDVEWRAYRGGQNTPLVILNLADLSEELIPNEKTTDINPVWLGDNVFFLSDRDWVMNIWSYNTVSKELKQETKYKDSDVKWLSGNKNQLVFEREGFLHTMNISTGKTTQLSVSINGDFPWAEVQWTDVSQSARSVTLSATGKRAIMEARGEIFTVPVENGNTRNLTNSSGVADRSPVWSPKGDKVAWFSDAGGKGYSLMIGAQDGLTPPKSIPIGESKLGWEPVWSPDGKLIAFNDNDVRIRVLDIESEKINTIDVAGNNLERGEMGLTWSPDSRWLAYSKSGSNSFRRINVWSRDDNSVKPITNEFADAFSPAWDAGMKHLYFLASTDLALGSGWANTSSITADPNYSVYVVNLRKTDDSPFKLKSDEEEKPKEEEKAKEEAKPKEEAKDKAKAEEKKKEDDKKEGDTKTEAKKDTVKIDFEGIDTRTLATVMPARSYQLLIAGPKESFFVGERVPNAQGLTLHKFTLEKRKTEEFVSGASQVSVSADGKKMLARFGSSWKIMDTSKPSGKDGENLSVNLKMKLDRSEEWKQMFDEAWRYQRDYFYDPNMHGRDWDEVYKRYSPLVPYIKHRADLTYILDQVNGELSVGHSFVFGGDYPKTDENPVGLLGADFSADNNRWKITRIYNTQSWNPELSSPLQEPGLKVETGNYIVGVNGREITGAANIYQFFDGTSGVQTVLHINKTPDFKDSWTITVKPIGSESALRQRAWVEDNRRLVDSLSNGKLAYIWVPNTGGPGFVSFNRYFFAQQDKLGAVIDERFNGGGLLDDYMVDLMTRSLRASVTNEVPNGKPMRLPAGILGPKVLLINELSGSGGDFFPWVFRQQQAGQLIGTTTWGGLVKSSVHYALIDGGALTAPDNAVFDPINNKWIAENEGVAPDITVRQDAKSLTEGRDPQLERGVKELLLLVEKQKAREITPPPFSTPAIKK
ncbi:MAG TPA: PDZ domain-containing protein [Draconibacterium sp.]|nr:PDZ domain-containing protein [Draconibacterium sp.]